MLELAEKELSGEAEKIYARVCGKAVDKEYEQLRRAATLSMIRERYLIAARKLIWC
jgi:hypothetical protein